MPSIAKLWQIIRTECDQALEGGRNESVESFAMLAFVHSIPLMWYRFLIDVVDVAAAWTETKEAQDALLVTKMLLLPNIIHTPTFLCKPVSVFRVKFTKSRAIPDPGQRRPVMEIISTPCGDMAVASS